MTKPRTQVVHLICNAHLDPVWLWEWEEGAAEAVSTFRTAAELCEKDENFIFNHNEVILYKWIQEYEPALFKRIQKLVKKGRWHIMGGWYLQPDCNMPSGESFVRQILLGKTYFKKHFGVEPKTAINFDPFGHSRGLVQILTRSGHNAYLFGRPRDNDLPLPAEDFRWVGYDGSEVLATRFAGWYQSLLGQAREIIEERMADNADREILAVLWGVGNHGGGPSKIDLREVNKLIRSSKDLPIRHSSPDIYFRELAKRRDQLPRVERDLNPWAPGCYSSQIRLKQKHRELENAIYSLEKMATTAATQDILRYPREEIDEALCDLMTGEFHDILPGSSIEPVEEAALRLFDHGLEIVARARARTFFALAAGQKKAKDGEIPVLVFNPHPYRVRTLVECEFNLPDFRPKNEYVPIEIFKNGKRVASQIERELAHHPCEWRKRVVFTADLDPGVMNRFDCRMGDIQKSGKPEPVLTPKQGKIRFKTADLDVVVNTRTGLIDRYRVLGIDQVRPNAFEPLIIDDSPDSWEMFERSFRNIAGRFKLMSRKEGSRFSGIRSGTVPSVRVIEEGPVRTVIEAVFSYGDSFVCQQYKLPAQGTEIEIQTRVHWSEKDKMVKLSIPVPGRGQGYLGQVAFGVGDLPTNGDESVAQKWVAVTSKDGKNALTCINDGTYSSDFSPDGLRLTLLRSPSYAGHPNEERKFALPLDRYSARMDQGVRIFRFWLNAGSPRRRLGAVDREALARNEKPFALSFYPPGGAGKKPRPLAVLSDSVLQLSALKPAESGTAIIARLFNPTDRTLSATLSLPALGKRVNVQLGAFEVRTWKIPRRGSAREVNLLER